MFSIMSFYQFKLFLLEIVLIVGLGYIGASILRKLNGGIGMGKDKGIMRYVIGGGVIGLFFLLRAIFSNFI